jgi:multicomponent Na+:H+ antiporter subunit B
VTDPFVVALLALVLAAAAVVVTLDGLLAAVVAFGVYSLGMALLWGVFRAPDVGLTEAAVGAGVTTSLLLAVIVRTDALRVGDDRAADDERGVASAADDARDAAGPVGVDARLAAGAVVALVALLLATVPSLPAVGDPDAPGFRRVAPVYLAEAPELGVKNVVTAVLVVYRGFDTFGELLVVFGAGLAVLTVLRRGASARAGGDDRTGGDPRPIGDPRERERRAAGGPLESPVVAKTVRLLTPLVLTYGLFTMFHGTSSVGGGFQGGVIVAAGVVAVAFAFGVDQTGRWLDSGALVAVATAGVFAFAAVALGSVALGAPFLDLATYPVPKAVVYGVELVEVGIGTTVAATVLVMFLELGGSDG